MPKQARFRVPLSEEDRLDVLWEKEGGKVVGFVVNYIANIRRRAYSVVRFDTSHGFPHKDINRPDGTVEHKEPLAAPASCRRPMRQSTTSSPTGKPIERGSNDG